MDLCLLCKNIEILYAQTKKKIWPLCETPEIAKDGFENIQKLICNYHFTLTSLYAYSEGSTRVVLYGYWLREVFSSILQPVV